jgi:hypothetical protein
MRKLDCREKNPDIWYIVCILYTNSCLLLSPLSILTARDSPAEQYTHQL